MKAPKKYTAKEMNRTVALALLSMLVTLGAGLYAGRSMGYQAGYLAMGAECVSILTRLRDHK